MPSEPVNSISRDPAQIRGDCFAALLRDWRAAGAASPALVMGVVNVTPDSFSDGGLFAESEAAAAQGRKLLQDGAAIIDIGGESTRAKAEAVSEEEELRRVLPVIERLRRTGAVISVDTMKASIAQAALLTGAHVINDIRGLQGDPDMALVVAWHGAGMVIMHNPGLLGSAQALSGDPVEQCLRFFERSVDIARGAGIPDDRIVVDPGLGFGKSVEQNLQLIARLPELAALGFPVLVGASRKSFIGKVTGRDLSDRLAGTLAAHVAAALLGAAIVRVHDAAEHRDALLMAAGLRQAGFPAGSPA